MANNEIAQYRAEIKEVVSNKEVFTSLAKNTFKGLNDANVPQALLQGMMKGFTIQDFMVGNVYAIPFGSTFSLVNSIDHVRKIAMKSGQSGKSAPEYTEDDKGNVKTCSVTVWKNGGDERGYTATVYFTEYNTGKNLWTSKPRTMIAKVAEMHALRAAFPEELQNVFVEEEFQKENVIEVEAEEVNEKDIKSTLKAIENAKTWEDLKTLYLELPKALKINQRIIDAKNERKSKLQDTSSGSKE